MMNLPFSQTNHRPKILFVVEAAALAHVVRSATLANSLVDHGYKVYFACDKHFEYGLANLKAERISIKSRSPSQLMEVLSKGGCLFDYDILKTYSRDEIDLFRRVSPDLVVGDFRPSLGASAVASKIKYFCITNAYWSQFANNRKLPFPCVGLPNKLKLSGTPAKIMLGAASAIYRALLPATLHHQGKGLNQLRADYGLKAFSNYFEGFTFGDSTFYVDLPHLIPMTELPSNHFFLGPISWSPPVELPKWWDNIDRSKALIYLCLGSSGDINVLNELIEGLATLDVELIVATAGRTSSNFRRHNVHCADFLPGRVVCEIANLVVANGGSPSIYQAMAAGVPIINVPFNMDQLIAARYSDIAGVSLTVRSDIANRKLIASAATNVLTNKKFSIRAGHMKSFYSQYDAVSNFNTHVQNALNGEIIDERVSNM